MSRIKVEREPGAGRLLDLGVRDWPIWTSEVSTFPWTYGESETCLLLEGEVEVTPDGGGDPVTIREGDLVTFPAGLSCTWRVIRPVRKHYTFG